jgi:hypothetical protein
MMWDDASLYLAAELQEPHVWGTITQKNAVMFYDNDFEVFIDPDGDNHNYYEFEMNALNTIWELSLTKPYRAGGVARLGTNLPGLKSAVFVDGTLNDPSDTDRRWCVELAFPFADLASYTGQGQGVPPRDGDVWRVGMSRVEWLMDIMHGKYVKVPGREEDNWLWTQPRNWASGWRRARFPAWRARCESSGWPAAGMPGHRRPARAARSRRGTHGRIRVCGGSKHGWSSNTA